MRDRPHPQHKLEWPGGVVPEWARPQQNQKRRGKGRGGPGGGGGGKRERLQKVMAQSGHGSRRNIEILIAQGHITINGQLAKLGDSVGPGDKVKLDGKLLNLRFGDPLPRVLVYHKPTGEIVTRDDPEKRPTVFDKLPRINGGRWVSVGRLDFNTEGLLLFTSSGELANRLTHPRFEVEREYAVRVMGELTEEQREKLLAGVDIDGELAKFDSIEDRGGEGSNHWYHVVLREGKNREVRRMMEAVNLMVSRLMRVRFGSVELPSHVKRGMVREMDEEQVQNLLAFAGVNEPPPSENGEEDDDVEDELDNVGNRAPDPARESKHREVHVDDAIGNRFVADTGERNLPDDNIGNRGTYGEGHAPPQTKPRRPHGGGKPFGFKKHGGGGHRGDNDNRGNVAPSQGQAHGHGHGQRFQQGQGHQGQGHQGQGQGQGHGQGQGKKHRHRGHQKPKMHGQGQNPPQAPRPEGQGAPQQAHTPGQPGQPGQGKRHRRNKNRNRHRGGNQTPPNATPT